MNLLLTNPIVQLPLLIALVAPVILFSIPHSPKICPLLPIDDNARVDPLLEGMIATARHIRRNNNNASFCILFIASIQNCSKAGVNYNQLSFNIKKNGIQWYTYIPSHIAMINNKNMNLAWHNYMCNEHLQKNSKYFTYRISEYVLLYLINYLDSRKCTFLEW